MQHMSFDKFKEQWHKDTFMEGAFGAEQDFEAYIDDPETDLDDEIYGKEIMEYMFPVLDEMEIDFYE